MILTLDLGTSVTKAAFWEEDGLVGIGRSPLTTYRSTDDVEEQEPETWWSSVKQACATALASTPGGRVEVIGFSAARQTFVPVDSEMQVLGKGLLWSDRRGAAEAQVIVSKCGGIEEIRRRTGLYVDAGGVAAKLMWLADHEPERIKKARWLLSPRDLVVWKMTGVVATDVTLASASGLYDSDGALVTDVLETVSGGLDWSVGDLLPDPKESSEVIGELLGDAARELGLEAGIPVVVGAGDRPCEVLGSGASEQEPMVSWGTTANVSVPTQTRPDPIPTGMIATRSLTSGWLLEGGLSAAGSLLDWMARLCGTDALKLMEISRSSPPGSRGALVMPWLGGARAPWWRSDASASVLGIRAAHDLADLARAAVEGVALEVARCIDSVYGDGTATPPSAIALGGGGSTSASWVEILTGVTGLPARRRRSGEAASAGAALVAGRALGREADLDLMDPVVSEVQPDRAAAAAYASLRPRADGIAAAAVSMAKPSEL